MASSLALRLSPLLVSASLLAPVSASLLAPAAALADDIGDSISLELTGTVPNQYVFRGLVLKDKGLISQADADLRVSLIDNDDIKFMVLSGFWISLHPGDEVDGQVGPASWYEARIRGGLGVSAHGVDALAYLVAYSSPNSSFEDVYEITLEAAYRDDTFWAGDDEDAIFRGIFPKILLAQELKGARDGVETGRYAELSIAPRMRALSSSLLIADFAMPASAGFGFGGYYELPSGPMGRIEDHAFGFASLGLLADLGLRFLPERLGLYNLRGFFTILFPTAQHDVPNSRADSVEIVGGIQTALHY